ncbi:MAG TPA: hypothetical protein VI072_35820 [Polyangiaceae bacterium]
MKKMAMSVASALVALSAMTSLASASITSPGLGDAVVVEGRLDWAGSIITASCNVSFEGIVASSTSLSVGSGSGTCNSGGMRWAGFPWALTFHLNGTWTMRTVRPSFAVSGLGWCDYEGYLGGTYESDGIDTVMTVDDAGSYIPKTSGSALCPTAPTVSGEFFSLGLGMT